MVLHHSARNTQKHPATISEEIGLFKPISATDGNAGKQGLADCGSEGRGLSSSFYAASHVVYISIVGIDRVQSYPYYRVKLETERLIEASTILRATQFYELGWTRAIPRGSARC